MLDSNDTSSYLSSRLKEVFINGKWIANTNYVEILHDVSFEESICQVYDLNTIEALAFHIDYYVWGIIEFFEKGTLNIKDKFSFDRTQPSSDSQWQEMKNTYQQRAEKLVEMVLKVENNQWNEDFFKKEYGSYQRNIDGLIEHAYYHLGQIALIKKIIRYEGK